MRARRSSMQAVPPAPGARGFSMLECVAAVGLLATVAASFFATTSFIQGQQASQEARLGAAEVANRLMLMYLDDPESLPPAAQPIAYGHLRYQWELSEAPVTLTQAVTDSRAGSRPAARPLLEGLKQIVVRVWLSEESGGLGRANPTTATASVARVMHPFVMRNPDSFENMVQTEGGRARLIEQAMNMTGGGGGGARGGPANAGRSKPGSPETAGRPTLQRPGDAQRLTQPPRIAPGRRDGSGQPRRPQNPPGDDS